MVHPLVLSALCSINNARVVRIINSAEGNVNVKGYPCVCFGGI